MTEPDCRCRRGRGGDSRVSLVGKDNQSPGDGSHVNGLQTEELTQLREEVEELRKQSALLQTQLGEKEALVNTLVSVGDTTSLCVWKGLASWSLSAK